MRRDRRSSRAVALPPTIAGPIGPVSIAAHTVTTACGHGSDALARALQRRESGLVPNDFTAQPLHTMIGRVAGAQKALPSRWRAFDCRNNRLAWHALQADAFEQQVRRRIDRHGARRVGLVLGSSTSSVGETEAAYRELRQDGNAESLPVSQTSRPFVHTPHSPGLFVAAVLGIQGPCLTVSTACSSSAKVFPVAERWLRLGLADAVVVGGVDSLCDSVLHGFGGLQLISATACRPFDVARSGISLAEAAGFALLEREPAGLRLLGYGEASDAHHMSSPHPEAAGARGATLSALARAGLDGSQVDYLNLHGTASPMNDAIEARLVAACYGQQLHADATKGWTGHTLGAAGIVEAAVCFEALRTGFMPGILNADRLDPVCPDQIHREPARREVRVAVSNSFGFGGSNCVLVFGRSHD